MNNELFNELVVSVKEGSAILRGEKEGSRKFYLNRLDIKRIRVGYKLTQAQFAAMVGISVLTLRNWEQSPYVTEGPAMVLLKVADKHPEAVLDAAGK